MENNIRIVNSVEDLKGLRHNELIRYTCRNCGKLAQRQYRVGRKNIIVKFLCKYCYREHSFMSKYGVKHQMHLKAVKDKMSQTMLDKYGAKYTQQSKELVEKCKESLRKHYGVDNPFKSKEIREKIKQTVKDRYGVDYVSQNKDIYAKVKATNRKKYGCESSMQNKEVQAKFKATNMRKYGTDHHWKSPEVREKIKQTFNHKYGVDYAMQSNDIKNKAKISFLNKYGVDNPLKHPYVIKRIVSSRGRKYSYNGEKFDSSWELALWIYAKDHGEPIERVEEPFEYYDGDKKHYYFPDFKYKGELIEIKGPQFVNNSGIMYNPYDSSQDKIFAAKQQCAIENGVRFVFEKDIQFAIDYARNKFGGSFQWYNQFNITPTPAPLQLTPLLPFTPMYIYPTIPMMLPWWMFMTPCDFSPYSTNVFEREGMEFVDCECEYE